LQFKLKIILAQVRKNTTPTPQKTTTGKSKTKSKGITGFWQKTKKFLLISTYFFFGSSIFFTILYRFVPPVVTPLMIIRCGQQLFNGDKIRLKYTWKNYDEISPKMPLAVVCSEDAHYKEHFGFDIDAIYNAYKSNQKKGKKAVKGGSTISQQTAKNVFLWAGRSWIRKGLEVYFTFLIETLWGKKRIMEVYINVIEMGKGVYGAEAAAQKYYHKPAKKLTKYEAAAIASILPSPLKWNPTNPHTKLAIKQQRIIRDMNYVRKINF